MCIISNNLPKQKEVSHLPFPPQSNKCASQINVFKSSAKKKKKRQEKIYIIIYNL